MLCDNLDVRKRILYLEKLEHDVELQNIEIILCRRNPYYWLTNWVYTQDPADEKNTIKRFPEKSYVKYIADLWLREKYLLIPKSRQIMITWLMISLHLWLTIFHEGKMVFIQSKTSDDADILIGRAKFIYERLPRFMRRSFKKTYNLLDFPDLNSRIMGVASGGDKIRMHTASAIFIDEGGFVEKLEETHTASKPCLGKDGKLTIVSSANPGYFEKLVMDEV